MSYESTCLAWGNGTYRPAYGLNASAGWPAPPATGATGSGWATWLDAPGGYRDWFADPQNSGSNGPPPPPPKGN